MTMITIQSPVPPAIARIANKTMVVPGWVEVPAGTTLNDIDWIRPVMVKPEMVTKHVSKYIVSIYTNGKVTCDCPGYTFRRKCKHADAER